MSDHTSKLTSAVRYILVKFEWRLNDNCLAHVCGGNICLFRVDNILQPFGLCVFILFVILKLFARTTGEKENTWPTYEYCNCPTWSNQGKFIESLFPL